MMTEILRHKLSEALAWISSFNAPLSALGAGLLLLPQVRTPGSETLSSAQDLRAGPVWSRD